MEAVKIPGGKRTRRKGNEGRREGCRISLAFKTLPDCILKARWTENRRLLANARPELWHPWRCNIKSQLTVKFYYST